MASIRPGSRRHDLEGFHSRSRSGIAETSTSMPTRGRGLTRRADDARATRSWIRRPVIVEQRQARFDESFSSYGSPTGPCRWRRRATRRRRRRQIRPTPGRTLRFRHGRSKSEQHREVADARSDARTSRSVVERRSTRRYEGIGGVTSSKVSSPPIVVRRLSS